MNILLEWFQLVRRMQDSMAFCCQQRHAVGNLVHGANGSAYPSRDSAAIGHGGSNSGS